MVGNLENRIADNTAISVVGCRAVCRGRLRNKRTQIYRDRSSRSIYVSRLGNTEGAWLLVFLRERKAGNLGNHLIGDDPAADDPGVQLCGTHTRFRLGHMDIIPIPFILCILDRIRYDLCGRHLPLHAPVFGGRATQTVYDQDHRRICHTLHR